jgi:hypothetical protein
MVDWWMSRCHSCLEENLCRTFKPTPHCRTSLHWNTLRGPWALYVKLNTCLGRLLFVAFPVRMTFGRNSGVCHENAVRTSSPNFKSKLSVCALMWSAKIEILKSLWIHLLLMYQGALVAMRRHLDCNTCSLSTWVWAADLQTGPVLLIYPVWCHMLVWTSLVQSQALFS